GTGVGAEIRGDFMVDSAGSIVLGPNYGAVKVSGMTRVEAEDAVVRHLRKILSDPVVALTIDESAPTLGIVGKHLVGPDGRINLGTYGSVYLAGHTIAEARSTIEKHLAKDFSSILLSV